MTSRTMSYYDQLVDTLENELNIFNNAYGHNATKEWFILWLTARCGFKFVEALKANDLI